MSKFYDWLALQLSGPDCPFLNYGYVNPHLPEPTDGDPHVTLLTTVLDGAQLDGRKILEVGCGRGGSCMWIDANHRADVLIGVDRSVPNLVSSKDRAHEGFCGFFCGCDAHELPFGNEVFDVVLNIESSHCYRNLHAFVAEVVRVLKPGGMLCWADLWGLEELGLDWERRHRALHHDRLSVIRDEDLSEGVFRALKSPSSLPDKLREAVGPDSSRQIEPIVRNIETIRLHLAAAHCDYRLMQLEKTQPGRLT